ncbi:transmembrane protein 229B-like [Dermacentor silvarum]|uniref:transmembrane protein 229B-like n=1 Tax=Dermacentor silvarum TaxID=543639 RepID=UPI0021016283|nr:transmembrane protein 229B-like [Dermacentor silvarum]
MATQCLPLSSASRLYLYALHGYFTEVTFTAVWDLLATGNPELRGYSSIWSLAVYSFCCMGMENIGSFLHSRAIPLPVRALAYTCWIYAWEFTTGSVLRVMGTCPWNYKHFRYNFSGLVTLEYAPLWFLCGLLFELLLRPMANKLAWMNLKESRTNAGQNGGAAADAVENVQVSPIAKLD